MASVNELNLLYEELEKTALDYNYERISELFVKIRNNNMSNQKTQWEIDCFSFRIVKNQLKSMIERDNEKYPDLDTFSDETYNYYNERLNNTEHPLLKARYAHVLWFSPKKERFSYAKEAIDAYLKLIELYEGKNEYKPEKNYGMDLVGVIQNTFILSHQVKYKTDEIKKKYMRIIKDFPYNNKSCYYLRSNLVQIAVDNHKHFDKKELIILSKVCWQTIESLEKQKNTRGKITMAKWGQKIDKKIKSNTHNWNQRIAEAYEMEMICDEKCGNPAFVGHCKSAIKYYKLCENKSKVEQLKMKYEILKNKVPFQTFSVPFDQIELKKYYEKCKKIGCEFAKESPEKIIKILMTDKNLLPEYSQIVKKANRESFINSLSICPADEDGHSIGHFESEEEKKHYRIIEEYGRCMELDKLPLIIEMFNAVIFAEKLTTKTIIAFFRQYSWLGSNIIKEAPTNKTIKHNWLDLITPIFDYFFEKMLCYLQKKTEYPTLILPIDSLTMKFEGIFRDIAFLTGKITSNINENKRTVTENDIKFLLEKQLSDIFNQSDNLFFKYLLVEKTGIGLRLNIAHTRLSYEHYSIEFMYLLILALLRIGKYNIIKPK